MTVEGLGRAGEGKTVSGRSVNVSKKVGISPILAPRVSKQTSSCCRSNFLVGVLVWGYRSWTGTCNGGYTSSVPWLKEASSWEVEKATGIGAMGKKSKRGGCGDKEAGSTKRRAKRRGGWKGGGNATPGFHAADSSGLNSVQKPARDMIKNDRGTGGQFGKVKIDTNSPEGSVSGDHITSKFT